MNTLNALAALLVVPLESQWAKFGQSIEDRDAMGAIFHLALLVLYIIALTAAALGLCALAMQFWAYLLIPASIVGILYYLARKKPAREPEPEPKHEPKPIEVVRAWAEQKYLSMKPIVLVLFQDLTKYIGGLVKPTTVGEVVAAVSFDITKELCVIFHFIIGKGQCSTTPSTVKEILERIIGQRFDEAMLLTSIDKTYTSLVDGSTWPGLVVDGVYDMAYQYRVDLIITNEAAVTLFKARAEAAQNKGIIDTPIIHDEDFD